MKKNKALQDIFVKKGYYNEFKISKKDTNFLKNLIKGTLLRNVKKIRKIKNKDLFYKALKKVDLKNYHKISNTSDHRNLIKKKYRLIKPTDINKIKKLNFFKKLKKIIPGFKILNIEKIYKEEIDFRIARPNKKDTGYLHRDEWFWTLNNLKIKNNCTKLNIWIPIICEKGRNGLRYVHKSHLKEYEIKSTNKRYDGVLKPGLIKDKLNISIFKSNPGECFIFNDRLIHGGLSGGTKTRISMQWIMTINNNILKKYVNQKYLDQSKKN